jgi:hypothetical protein
MTITKVQYRSLRLAQTSSQGLMDTNLAKALREGWRIEGVLPHSNYEWTVLLRRRVWFRA